jgi:UDP-N-acetylglucosamine 2-epimerase (non-hydrolysing)
MRLVGTSTDRIVKEARKLVHDPIARASMARRCFPYGDGRAAPRIAAVVADWLEKKSDMPLRGAATQ